MYYMKGPFLMWGIGKAVFQQFPIKNFKNWTWFPTGYYLLQLINNLDLHLWTFIQIQQLIGYPASFSKSFASCFLATLRKAKSSSQVVLIFLWNSSRNNNLSKASLVALGVSVVQLVVSFEIHDCPCHLLLYHKYTNFQWYKYFYIIIYLIFNWLNTEFF